MSTTLAEGERVVAGQVLEFDVIVEDPDGDPFAIRLLNPPAGLVFDPVLRADSPQVVRVRWTVSPSSAPRARLLFRAEDDQGQSGVSTHAAVVLVAEREDATLLTGDVTGDGLPDVVGAAVLADAGSVNTGELYVWEGGAAMSSAPTASLTVPSASPGDRLGISGDQGIHLVDVTGDGILDIVAGAEAADSGGIVDAGAVHVWEGGPALSGPLNPTASLTVPGASAGDRIGETGVYFRDVTGDFLTDVIVASDRVDNGALVNTGAIYVWEGGFSLSGSPAPTATLAVSSAVAGDRLTAVSGQGVQFADVTGDSIEDIIAGAQFAEVNGIVRQGAIYVWEGGNQLIGSLDPDIRLAEVQQPNTADQLGSCSGQGIVLADVSGDGEIDIVSGTPLYDSQGVPDTGALFVWFGGPGLLGHPDPHQCLVPDNPQAGDRAGLTSGQAIQAADVTGDGTLDLVVGAQDADLGTEDAGAVFVWEGNSQTGTRFSRMTLRAQTPSPHDRLTEGDVQGVQLADLDGDARLDVIASAPFADVFGVPDSGGVYVWLSQSLVNGFGDVPSDSDLTTFGQTSDRVGFASGQGVQFADVTGDGQLDVVAAAPLADFGTIDQGVIYVWEGGPNIQGNPSPLETLRADSPQPNDRLGNAVGQGVQLGDVTGDGVVDVIAGAEFADNGGTSDVGAVFVWQGGSNLQSSPLAHLLPSTGQTGDRLGSSSVQGVQLADVTGDGALDVLVGTRFADRFGVLDAGAIYLWRGGIDLQGTPFETSVLLAFQPLPGDQLGFASERFLLVDLSGDAIPDITCGAQLADEAGVANTGAVYVWQGRAAFDLEEDPDAELSVPGAQPGDQLGG